MRAYMMYFAKNKMKIFFSIFGLSAFQTLKYGNGRDFFFEGKKKWDRFGGNGEDPTEKTSRSVFLEVLGGGDSQKVYG